MAWCTSKREPDEQVTLVGQGSVSFTRSHQIELFSMGCSNYFYKQYIYIAYIYKQYIYIYIYIIHKNLYK